MMRNLRKIDYKKEISQRLNSYSRHFLLVLLFILTISLLGSILKARDVKERIETEKKKLEVMEKENKELEKKVIEAQSQEYIEKQLRDKLGLAKEGEIVLVLPDEETLKKLAPVRKEEEEILPDPTWKRWLKLFI